MSNRTTFSLSYFLGRAFFLGFGYSLILSMTSQDSWICFLVGSFLGMIFVFIFSTLKKQMKEQSLKEYLKQNKLFKFLILSIFFLFNMFIIIEIMSILETFASSFFLINSPPYFILLPILYLMFRITKKGWQTIGRVGELFMPVSLCLFLLTAVILIFYGKLDHFLPVITHDKIDFITCTLYYAFYSSSPFLLFLNAPVKESKFTSKYLFASFTVTIMGIIIIAVLGSNLIQIYRFPEYMVLKKIQIFSFLEKIENVISMASIVDLFMILATCSNNIKDILPKKKRNIVFPIILLLHYIIVILIGNMYYVGLTLYHILPIVLGIFEILLLLILYIYHLIVKKKPTNS